MFLNGTQTEHLPSDREGGGRRWLLTASEYLLIFRQVCCAGSCPLATCQHTYVNFHSMPRMPGLRIAGRHPASGGGGGGGNVLLLEASLPLPGSPSKGGPLLGQSGVPILCSLKPPPLHLGGISLCVWLRTKDLCPPDVHQPPDLMGGRSMETWARWTPPLPLPSPGPLSMLGRGGGTGFSPHQWRLCSLRANNLFPLEVSLRVLLHR